MRQRDIELRDRRRGAIHPASRGGFAVDTLSHNQIQPAETLAIIASVITAMRVATILMFSNELGRAASKKRRIAGRRRHSCRPNPTDARGKAGIENAEWESGAWIMVETRRIELPTFALRTRRSPS